MYLNIAIRYINNTTLLSHTMHLKKKTNITVSKVTLYTTRRLIGAGEAQCCSSILHRSLYQVNHLSPCRGFQFKPTVLSSKATPCHIRLLTGQPYLQGRKAAVPLYAKPYFLPYVLTSYFMTKRFPSILALNPSVKEMGSLWEAYVMLQPLNTLSIVNYTTWHLRSWSFTV